MLNRKLLVDALRIDNKEIIPKFGSESPKAIMEAATEYLSIDAIMDYEEGAPTQDGVFSILDLLNRGSAGIVDSEGQPALTFIKSGSEIYAHNMFTDEDDVLDATPEALQEYIADQMDTRTFEEATENAANVIFFREPNEYTDEVDILAAFIDEIEQPGDEGRILVYSHVGQHGYADQEYLEGLEEATPEEYEPLKQELEQQGYELNVLNGIQDESVSEASNRFKSLKDARRAIATAKRKLQKKLDKGDFYENFGQDELREIRDQVPSYAEDMNQDEFNMIQKEVTDFGEWCSTASPKKEAVNEEDLKNYAVVVAKDIGNDYDLVEFKEGFHSYEEAQKELQSIEDNLEKDPTLMVFIAYSDGMSWFDAETGEELDLESPEKEFTNEDYSVDSALSRLDDEIKSAKATLDKIQQRVVYRMKENVSYTGDDAIDRIDQVADKISQNSSDLHEFVYNDVIG